MSRDLIASLLLLEGVIRVDVRYRTWPRQFESVGVLVEGGDNQQIARTILGNNPACVGTHWTGGHNVSVLVDGVPVLFSRPGVS